MDSWDRIKESLATRVSTEAYQNWLSKTALIRAEGSNVWVSVPDDITRQWMQQEFASDVWTAIHDLGFPFRHVFYEVPQTPAHNGTPFTGEQRPTNPDVVFAPSISLNPKFTFDTFVVGSCNQFAHAAAKAVATVPARKYNPLFIYGGVGMGKTHLMHAIGRELVDRFAGMKIVFTTSERFMNEMINCIKLDRMMLFHQHYRSADVLLIDDIHVLAGKERTQEEFFHTFNELYEHNKQIIISSDSMPKSTPGLVERLRSRFEWGLMVDVQAPDLETKMAILDKKAEQQGVNLPPEVRVFIATKTKSNVRELEGALVKLIAYSSVTTMPITLAMAQQTLKSLTHAQERKVSIEAIIKAVAERFAMQTSQLKQKSNSREIAYPRQVAMFLVKELTSASLPEIGRAFGGKHHTTVLHSINKIDKQRQTDGHLNSLVNSLIDSFQ